MVNITYLSLLNIPTEQNMPCPCPFIYSIVSFVISISSIYIFNFFLSYQVSSHRLLFVPILLIPLFLSSNSSCPLVSFLLASFLLFPSDWSVLYFEEVELFLPTVWAAPQHSFFSCSFSSPSSLLNYSFPHFDLYSIFYIWAFIFFLFPVVLCF